MNGDDIHDPILAVPSDIDREIITARMGARDISRDLVLVGSPRDDIVRDVIEAKLRACTSIDDVRMAIIDTGLSLEDRKITVEEVDRFFPARPDPMTLLAGLAGVFGGVGLADFMPQRTGPVYEVDVTPDQIQAIRDQRAKRKAEQFAKQKKGR